MGVKVVKSGLSLEEAVVYFAAGYIIKGDNSYVPVVNRNGITYVIHNLGDVDEFDAVIHRANTFSKSTHTYSVLERETEQEAKIRNLQETIDKAQQQIKEPKAA